MYRNFARHAAGAAAAWLMFCVEGVLAYIGLLVFASVTDADTGGPLAGPLLVLLAAVAGGFVTAAVLLPSVLAAEAARRRRWLLAFGSTAVLLALVALLLTAVTTTTAREAVTGWLVAVAVTVLPLTAWSGVAAIGARFRRSPP